MNSPISNHQPCFQLSEVNIQDIEKNKNIGNQSSRFCNKSVKCCKKVINYLANAFMILGGIGVAVSCIVQPLMSINLPQTHLNSSSVCYNETETRINAYDSKIVKASLISGFFAGCIPNLVLGAKIFGEKIAQNTATQ